MGKSFRDYRGYNERSGNFEHDHRDNGGRRSNRNCASTREVDNSRATIYVNLDEVFIPDTQVAKLLARDGQQIEAYRESYENGEDMVRVVLRPRFDGGYNVEDGRHRVIAAKQAGVGVIEALIIG